MKIDDGSTIDDAGKISNLSAEAVAAKLLELAPSVYEDPFCAVTADGTVHISEYYLVSDPLANAQRFSNHDVCDFTDRFILVSRNRLIKYRT